MNKKPYYRQSAIVFLLIGFIFTLNGLAALLSLTWISNIATAVVFIAIVYAIVSTLVIEKNNKRNF